MLCPSCLEEKGPAVVCGLCRFDESVGPAKMCLPFRHKLQGGAYVVGKILGSPGGFGVAYKALDTVEGSVVVIKEFQGPASPHVSRVTGQGHIDVEEHFEERYARSLAHFRREAELICRFTHRNIVRVLKVFDENNTSYYVMPFVDSSDLGQYLKDQGGVLSPDEVLSIARDLLSGLEKLHGAGTLHCDIKPSNVLITRKRKRAILIDFGAARRLPPKDETHPVLYSRRYAPRELATRDLKSLGRWTDIYLLSATLYECLTGTPPPTDEDRRAGGEDPYVPVEHSMPNVEPSLASLIDRGLALPPSQRPGSASKALQTLPAPPPPPPPPVQAPSQAPTLTKAQWIGLLAPEAGLLLLGLLTRSSFLGVLMIMLVYAAIWFGVLVARARLQPPRMGIELALVGSSGVRTVVRKMRPNESVTIGRSQGVDIPIANAHLSNRHVSITLGGNGMFTLKDLKSLNHTYLQPRGTDAPPQQWQRISSVTEREGKFMLGDHQDGGVYLEIKQVPLDP